MATVKPLVYDELPVHALALMRKKRKNMLSSKCCIFCQKNQKTSFKCAMYLHCVYIVSECRRLVKRA